MPTVPCIRELLFRAIGRRFTEKEFDDFTFDFGLEIDDVTTLSQVVQRADAKPTNLVRLYFATPE